ncbi:PREDICTED: uncharacterized protein LOC105366546 isoform X2 [Ceratosolen solmsi marchali]|uniref:Uncharacterized protein LOC105366546 isoform X2 n=1 Tax=Ceratosolen solmsi marchali TaxID=326594 RepID=A0AAJ6YSD2_9HYME|nr:PREDICTED: uncharacterized protein LOC105366546 isoform X2 [Ceratosolen solmsi marchali]
MKISLMLFFVSVFYVSAQRITTIQLDGVQYFISRMNPYSPELNYFLAYQYCRSLGLQLVSFETREKADIMTQYLKNAGYMKYDFWTSGNNLGTDMFLWMSTGLPFNTTFDYMLKSTGNKHVDVPPGTEPQRVARERNRRLYFNNSTMTTISTMTATMSTTKATGSIPTDYDIFKHNETKKTPTFEQDFPEKLTEVSTSTEKIFSQMHLDEVHNKNLILKMLVTENLKNNSRPIHLPHITSLFTESSVSNDNVFAGLQTHEIRSIVRTSIPTKQMITKSQPEQETESTNNTFEDNYTIGPYDSNNQDYQSDQSELMLFQKNQQQYSQKNFDDDSSTILPEAEPSYRYNIKVRNYGKVLDPLFN